MDRTQTARGENSISTYVEKCPLTDVTHGSPIMENYSLLASCGNFKLNEGEVEKTL